MTWQMIRARRDDTQLLSRSDTRRGQKGPSVVGVPST